jgi:hypothetical protein
MGRSVFGYRFLLRKVGITGSIKKGLSLYTYRDGTYK